MDDDKPAQDPAQDAYPGLETGTRHRERKETPMRANGSRVNSNLGILTREDGRLSNYISCLLPGSPTQMLEYFDNS